MLIQAKVFQNLGKEGRMPYGFIVVGYRNEYKYD
jgi:hypothetical protein